MPPKLPLPRGWNRHAKSAILHILALSHYTFTAMLARASNQRNRRTRLRAEIDRLRHEIALLQEELRIKDARMNRVPRHRRPHYVPLERMAILELRAARAWSARQAAERFHVTATYRRWCRRRRIRLRYGAVGKHGSIAIIERFFRTLKDECTRRILVPFGREALWREIGFFIRWYNGHRPHGPLGVRTPDEVYGGLAPACERARLELRPRWPRWSKCASPQAPVDAVGAGPVQVEVKFVSGPAAFARYFDPERRVAIPSPREPPRDACARTRSRLPSAASRPTSP